MRRHCGVGVGVVAVCAALVVGAPAVSASTHKSSTSTSHSSAPAPRVLPVISCTTTYGNAAPIGVFVPHQLPTTTSARGMTFYSNGFMTVLGPAGWACTTLLATDGGEVLDVYPPGKPDYTATIVPKGGAVIQIVHEYTGHLPGADVVCASSRTRMPPMTPRPGRCPARPRRDSGLRISPPTWCSSATPPA